MKLSLNGYLDILDYEDISLDPYLDSGGVWTIGGGVTAFDGMKINAKTPRLSIDQAVMQYIAKLSPYIKTVDVATIDAQTKGLKQYQFDALVSFHYNTGAIRKATLTKIINENPFYLEPIRKEFMKWVYDNGQRVNGLVARRKSEALLYCSGIYTNTDGCVQVFPVDKNTHKPIYMFSKDVDVKQMITDLVK